MGFAFATVILDRFLDIIAVAVIFIIFQTAGIAGPAAAESAALYEAAVIIIGAGLIVCGVFSTRMKKIAAGICSVFNDAIRLEGMKFFWSLINTFRDLRRIDIEKTLVNTMAMWAAYLTSYGLFALYLAGTGGFAEVFIAMFSGTSLGLTALGSMRQLGIDAAHARMAGSLIYCMQKRKRWHSSSEQD